MLSRNRILAVVAFVVAAFAVLIACPPGRVPSMDSRHAIQPQTGSANFTAAGVMFVADPGSSTDAPETVSACPAPDEKRMLEAVSARAYDCDRVVACRLGGTRGLPAAALRCRNTDGLKDYILILYKGAWVASEVH